VTFKSLKRPVLSSYTTIPCTNRFFLPWAHAACTGSEFFKFERPGQLREGYQRARKGHGQRRPGLVIGGRIVTRSGTAIVSVTDYKYKAWE
jgi:hypothetical protein